MLDFKNIIKFEGLNALRCIAALLVVLHHGEALKATNGIDNFEWLGLFRNGGNAVTFFFVLSGFLITYLLLKEHDRTGTIKVKTFYLKRILRIWPLYFLLVFIGTIGVAMVMPILNLPYELPYLLGQTWYYFLFFVPGLVTFYFGHHFLEPLWSIGVEEVFYLLWAPLFKWSKNKILRLIMVILFLKILINIIAYNFISNDLINYLISTFQFEAMAIGALGAYFLYTNGSSLFQWHIFRIPYQIVLISILCVYLLFHVNVEHFIWRAVFETPVLSRLILDFLFLYVIICVSVIPQSIVKLRSRSLSFLGEISYGIYMYHLLIVSTVIMVLKDQLIQQGPFFSMGVFYLIVIPLSIGVAALSKRFFEDYFLNLKNKMI